MLGFQTWRHCRPSPAAPCGAALTESERHQLVVEWMILRKSRGVGEQMCHCLFEDQVERTQRQWRWFFEDKQLTYRELNSRSN